MSPELLAQVLQHLDVIPKEFSAECLGTVTRCTFEGEELSVKELTVAGGRENMLQIICDATPKLAEIVSPKPGGPFDCGLLEHNPVRIETSSGFTLEEAGVLCDLHKLTVSTANPGFLIRCTLFDWVVLQADDAPCLWVSPAGFEKEPLGIRSSRGNLRPKGYPHLTHLSQWVFRGTYTILLLNHGASEWLVVVDTGSSRPPDPCILVDLTVIGFLIGHPLHLSVFHRLSADGRITGHASSRLAQIGHTDSLWAGAVPRLEGPFAVDFFNKIMGKLKENPDWRKMVLAPIGHHFEGHGRSFESDFAHAWIALESLISRAQVFGLIQRKQEILADKDRWIRWVNAHAEEIKAFGTPGLEHTFLNAVRQFFDAKPTRVASAFEKCGIPWTAEMDEVGKLRGEYIHEGGPRDPGYQKTMDQINLLRTMLAVLYARLFGYEGPVSDFAGAIAKEPSWWPAKCTTPEAELITIQAPSAPAT